MTGPSQEKTMNSRRPSLFFVAPFAAAFVLALAAAVFVTADEPKADAKADDAQAAAATEPAKDEEGFVPLFNGKGLTGWVYGGKNGEVKSGKGYQVEDEVLFCTAE